ANDSNGDGIIDQHDDIWTHLRVWRDLDSNGTSSPNELQTMEQIGIASISLAGTLVGHVAGDNLIHSTTTFDLVSGETYQAAAVFFGVDLMVNRSDHPQVIDGTTGLLRLPNVKGYGKMADLRV